MKSHAWESEQLIITITDGPAKGVYKPRWWEVTEDGLLGIGPGLRTRVSDYPGLQREIDALRARRQEAARNAPHKCRRCGQEIRGEAITWSKEKHLGSICETPYCAACARLLRIFAGGIGVAGERLEGGMDDRTVYHKGEK